MPLFIIFIFGAVIIGTGALLAPAWRTDQPRIGLAAALALALVTGGALFYAMLFGWDTLTVDYLLFALVTTIFLLGTLTFGQKRAEARGIALGDFAEGWPGPADLLLLTLAGLIFIVPALIVPVPLDTDAQGFGYLALMARLGGGFDTLAPFHPDIHYLYAPAFSALVAYLSEQLGQGIHQVQMSVGAVLCLLLVWLAYDFGAEVRDKRLGRAFALALIGGVGLFTAYMDSHFTTLLALVFALAFLTYIFRYLRGGWWLDAVAAALLLGAVVLSHPDTTIILALGYAPWLLTMWLGQPGSLSLSVRRWLVCALGVPLLALGALSPWLWRIRDLLGSDIVSPFEINPDYWRVMILYHGVAIVPLALFGAWIGLRRRDPLALLAAGWLVFALDFAAVGIVARLLPWLPILRYDYPFSIAWHAPIIPYTILGGGALLWLWERIEARRIGQWIERGASGILLAGIGVALLLGLFHPPILAWSKAAGVGFFGAFSSAADVEAMLWLKANTPPDARILNYPAPHEADWAPVIAERDTVYFRPQPFFRGTEAIEAEQARLLTFWSDPADPAHADLLAAAGIDYIIVPQIVTDPTSIESMWRWREPFTVEMASSVADAPYLELVFDRDGAQVYALQEAEAAKEG
jgi:hypothetical protein